MEKNIENMDFSGNRKKKEECFEMETKNKNKKKAIMLAVIGIAIVCICVIGVFAKKAYDRHQEELRLQAIETKNSEIDEEYQRFEKGEDRDKKLEALKQEMESAEKYKKTEGAYKECSVHYEKIIAQMKNSFVSEYDDTIKAIVDKIGDDVEKVDDKEALKNATSEFTTFKDILKNDFENYNTVEQDRFDKYNSTIDDYVIKYNDRVTAIEKAEEEARKKAEEEAKKTVEAIFPYVDFLFVSEETSRRMLQRTGTLEEITEIMSKVSLKQLNAPCIVYNLNGYYDGLKAMLKHMIDMGLSSEERQKGIYFAESLEQITDILCSLKED